jgi:glycosyltransferase involved in cell wall biosynthesis
VSNPNESQSVAEALRTQVAVVIPCYNAGPRVHRVVERVLSLIGHVVVVNDGSTDGATQTLHALPIRLITFAENRGKGFALLEGFRAALELPDISCVAVVDADGQHDPAEIPSLYHAWATQHADLAIGARRFDRRSVPWRSRFGNRLTVAVTAWLLRQRFPDTQSGFRLHSRPFLEDVIATIPGGRYETEMAILVKAIRERRGIVSVPIRTIYEEGNPSSHFRPVRDSFRVYRALFRAFLRP